MAVPPHGSTGGGAGGAGGASGEGQAIEWIAEDSANQIVYLTGDISTVQVRKTGGGTLVSASKDAVRFNRAGRLPEGPLPSTARLERLISLAEEGKVELHTELREHGGAVFQTFSDTGLGHDDWSLLGFFQPQNGRPALDIRGDNKGLSPRFICVPYGELDHAELACHSLWEHYVDSCHMGAYFTRLAVSHEVEKGVAAGWKPGTVILAHEDLVEGVPYRRADAPISARNGRGGFTASAVWHLNAQYFSFDPTAVSEGREFHARWKGSGGGPSLCAPAGKYSPARDVRRTHFVPPRTKTYNVWPGGSRVPLADKCVKSPGDDSPYVKRPAKGERDRLAGLYGRGAVPINFHKYTEGQIAKKSDLLSKVSAGTWVHIPDSSQGEACIQGAYRARGERPAISWHVLRQISGNGDIEQDPMGSGMFARLPTREEIFGNTPYFGRLIRVLRRDGMGFLVDEIAGNPEGLRKNLLTLAVS